MGHLLATAISFGREGVPCRHVCSRDDVRRMQYLDGDPQGRGRALGRKGDIHQFAQHGCGELVDVEGRQAGYEAWNRRCLSHEQLHVCHAESRPLKELLQALSQAGHLHTLHLGLTDARHSLESAKARSVCLLPEASYNVGFKQERCQEFTVILSVPGPWPSASFSASTRAAAILLTSVCMAWTGLESATTTYSSLTALCFCNTSAKPDRILM